MLKKSILLFIRVIPFILAINVLLQILSSFFVINVYLIELIKISSNIIIVCGVLLLSRLFSFCIYHRLLLYVLLGYYLLNICRLLTNDTYLLIGSIFIVLLTIFVILLIIYIYLTRQKK